MKVPNNEEDWQELINMTKERWQFQNCFAAADGKHISLRYPPGSGSDFYNYKGFYSVVLLAFVDFDYKLLFAEVGCQGRISDGGAYRSSQFFKALNQQQLGLPPPQPLPRSNDDFWFGEDSDCLPVVFVADDAFPLGVHCMKPFSQKGLTDDKRIFNYRLSRMRRISENAFGIWANRFRLFGTTSTLNPSKIEHVVLASLALHNMLRTKSSESYTPTGFIDFEIENGNVIPGSWREDGMLNNIKPIKCQTPHRPNLTAEKIREKFMIHFNGPGQIPWQWKVLYG